MRILFASSVVSLLFAACVTSNAPTEPAAPAEEPAPKVESAKQETEPTNKVSQSKPAVVTDAPSPKSENDKLPAKAAKSVPKPTKTEKKPVAGEKKQEPQVVKDEVKSAASPVEPSTAPASTPIDTNSDDYKSCKIPEIVLPEMARADVYKDVPFKPGEMAKYEGYYAGALAGYATMSVGSPIKHAGQWQRVLHAEVGTGDWYRYIFVVKDQVQAIIRPHDFGVSKFYLEQNEGKLFSKPFISKKWIEFDHQNCKVRERVKREAKPEKQDEYDLLRGSNGALGAAYHLRAKEFQVGKSVYLPVYTSEKNWVLEAEALAFEKVTVPAGTFDTVKLKMHTYIGQELQQKGDVFLWIATKDDSHQIVQIQAEIKIGSFWVKLKEFRPGRG